jgi:glyoxylase-like metal-dependent hydrolase (beta-lactamase superfamily II)
MRLRAGRPDIGRYAHRFSVPVAESGAPLTVTWLGVSTLLLDDGSSTLMTDGFFSRPSLARVGLGKVSPSPALVDGCLARLKLTRLDAVIPVHTHYDHALDSALVADRTGAQLVGGESAAYVGRGYGLAADRLVVAASGVVLVHWDDFFRPLSKPLRALPYAGDDLDFSLGVLSKLAEQDGAALDMPTVWRREDPWAGI